MPNDENAIDPPETEALYSGPGFKVGLQPNLELTWEVDPEKEISPEAHSLLARAKVIDVLPIPKIPKMQVRAWKLMVGHAVALALLDKLDDAAKTLAKGDEFISSRATEVAKGWYVKAVIIVIGGLLAIAATIGYSKNRHENKPTTEQQKSTIERDLKGAEVDMDRERLDQAMAVKEAQEKIADAEKNDSEEVKVVAMASRLAMIDDHKQRLRVAEAKVTGLREELARIDLRSTVFASLETFQIVVLTLLGGALGSAFSLLTRLGKIGVDPASGKWAHYTEVAFRITVGMLAAAVIVIAMKANLVLGFATSDSSDSHVWMLLILAIAAGSSERMVPSVLRQVESSAVQSEED